MKQLITNNTDEATKCCASHFSVIKSYFNTLDVNVYVGIDGLWYEGDDTIYSVVKDHYKFFMMGWYHNFDEFMKQLSKCYLYKKNQGVCLNQEGKNMWQGFYDGWLAHDYWDKQKQMKEN